MKLRDDTLTRGEQAIVSLLSRHRRMTSRQLADALESTPNSIKVMVMNLRRKGIGISSGDPGTRMGYKLERLA